MISKTVGSAVDLWSVALATGFTILAMAAITLLLTIFGPDWAAYAPATCTSTRCFCEMPRTGALIVQPANSWSSYAYVFAGLLMILLSYAPRWGSAFPPRAATIYGATATFVGLGSALLHATLTLGGQFFDVMGMYLVSAFMLVSALVRWRSMTTRQAALLYCILIVGLSALLYTLPEVRRGLFAVVLLLAIAVEMLWARPRRIGIKSYYYVTGIVIHLAAFAIWNLDQHGIFCTPSSLLQGHAVWHLLGAASMWCTFLYYRSERRTA